MRLANKRIFIGLVVAVLALISGNVFANDVVMGVGLALPPYFIEETKTGIELDIINEALGFKGHKVSFKFIPFARIPVDFASKKVDCVSTINESSGIKAHYSDSHISYQNFAIALKSNNLTISAIADLKDKEVLAFQNAKIYLGPEFSAMAEANPKYEEIANQSSQTIRLYLNRTQILVGDGNIFKYFSQKVSDKADTSKEIVYFSLFPKTDYKVAFFDEQLMKDFNNGLANLKSTGRWVEIFKKYGINDVKQ